MLLAAQAQAVSFEQVGGCAQRQPAFGCIDLHGRAGNHHAGDLILNLEYVLQRAVIVFTPHHLILLGVSQIDRHADAIACLADVAVDDIAHTQLRGDLAGSNLPALVHKGRIARDHEQVVKLGQVGGDVLGEAF